MATQRRQPAATTSSIPILRFLATNLQLVGFLLVSIAGMVAIYLMFNPTGEDAVSIQSAVPLPGNGLWAPISKNAASRPVLQRLAHGSGPRRVAIVVGHLDNDSGAACDDGLTEVQVNNNIANKVQAQLQNAGIVANLLSEFDPGLDGFAGSLLISIHADSCDYFNDTATGFKLAGSNITDSTKLSICLQTAYAETTNLPYHANTITPHMTDYHAFQKIAPGTPAVIIETGFMNLDRELLTTGAETPATGIVNGILCYFQDVSP